VSEPFGNKLLSFAPITPGFHVRINHSEYRPGAAPKVTERYEFPVIGWATVQLTRGEGAYIEPVFLWNGEPMHTTEYRRIWSDLTPDPGEPKRTVGIKVIHPEDCR
jgi:hypothetical protein